MEMLRGRVDTKQMQRAALWAYERFVETLDEELLIMFEEVLDLMFELDGELGKAELEEERKRLTI